MNAKSLAGDDRRRKRAAYRGKASSTDGLQALEKSDVGELSAAAISNMTCDELVRVIRVASPPALLGPDLEKRLPFYDHAVLARLAHLARRCCRNRGTKTVGTEAEGSRPAGEAGDSRRAQTASQTAED